MNTQEQSHEIVSAPHGWSGADTLKIVRMLAAAILIGLILRVMAESAPATSVAAKSATGAATDGIAHTESRR